MRKILLLASLFAISSNVYSQREYANSYNGIQYGISLKGSIEFLNGCPTYRFGINAGTGSPVFNNIFYPTANVEWQIFYRGLGSMSGYKHSSGNLNSDFILSLMLTGGCNYQLVNKTIADTKKINSPLFYFTDFIQPALQNPFESSLSLGTNWLFHLKHNNSKECMQRVGYVNAHVLNVQLGYYNDGGGLDKLKLGDGEDRYFTGGGHLCVSLPTENIPNQYLLSYHKYTGFYKNAFDLASYLNLTYTLYKDKKQQYFNKNYMNLTITDLNSGLSGFVRLNNIYNTADIQNKIHYVTNDAYHQVHYPRYWSMGGSYNSNKFYNQIIQ